MFINDYWELAIRFGSDDIRLGQEDLVDANSNKIYQCLFPILPNDNVSLNCTHDILEVLPEILGLFQTIEIIKWILKIGKLLER